MSKRNSLVVAFLLAGLVLVPQVGHAASPKSLGKRAVSRIAVKVVAHKSATLSVAHAAIADNATHASTSDLAANATHASSSDNTSLLAGSPPAAFQNHIYRFTSDFNSPQTVVHVPIHLPAGTYLISYSTFFNLASAGDMECFLSTPNEGTVGESTGYSTGYQGRDGEGIVEVRSGDVPDLICDADSFTTEAPVEIDALPIDSRTDVAVAPTFG